jgi:hypothetical protein
MHTLSFSFFFCEAALFCFLFAAFSMSPMIPLYPGGRAVCLYFCCDVERFMLGYRLSMFVYTCTGEEFEMKFVYYKKCKIGVIDVACVRVCALLIQCSSKTR